jgi:exosortase D (VPLPA-CTERM-specific)
MPAVRPTNTKRLSLISIGIMLAGFLLSYWPALQKLGIRWNSEDNSYCYLIIPLFIYLCLDMKKVFRFSEFSWNWWGVISTLLAVLIIIAGEMGSTETLVYLGIWGCIAGVLHVLYGRRLIRLSYPLLILAFLVPLPPFIGRVLTFNLKMAASKLSTAMLRIAGVSVVQDGNIIDIGIIQLQVVDACSGLRYFMPLILMALLFGYFFGRRLWHKIVLLAVVLPLSIVVNGLRIFGTGMLYMSGFPELAENFFHDFSGWLVFVAAAFALFGVSFLLGKLGPQERQAIPKDAGCEGTPLRLQATMGLTLCLLFVSSGWAMQNLPAARDLPQRSTFESFPMKIGLWSASRNYLSKAILDELWADDYLSATFQHPRHPNQIRLFIPFYAYQGSRHTAHAPQSCLLGSGWALIKSRQQSVGTGDGTDITIMTSIWKKGDTYIISDYFFFERGRVIINPWMNKYWLLVDAFSRHRTDGALIRAEMPLAPGQSIVDAERVLNEFVSEVFSILPAFVPI